MHVRRCLIALSLAATLSLPLCAALPARADDAPPPPIQTQEQGAQQRPHHKGRFHQALQQIGLSQDQKQQIRQIRQQNKGQHNGKAVRQQILAVLTPEQRQQLRQMLPHGHHRQQQNAPPPGS